jgi:hypothetical protein
MIPTELLLRLMNATPEQFAAVEKILTTSPATNPEPPVSMGVATTAFALMLKLELKGKFRDPTPLTVFKYYCVEKMSADKVAETCRCAKGTVMSRLRFIQSKTKTKPEQFRAMSGHFQQLLAGTQDKRAREIYLQGLAQESGPEEYLDQ